MLFRSYVMNGGTLTIATGIEFGDGANGGKGRFEMTGGTVTVPTIQRADAANATLVLNGGVLRATASNAEFIKNIGELTVGGVTIDTTEHGYALGVSNTALSATPGTTPAITLAGSGSLDLSGVGVELKAKPTVQSYVLATVAEGSQGRFVGTPTLVDSVYTSNRRLKVSADGKHIRIVGNGFTVFVK